MFDGEPPNEAGGAPGAREQPREQRAVEPLLAERLLPEARAWVPGTHSRPALRCITAHDSWILSVSFD